MASHPCVSLGGATMFRAGPFIPLLGAIFQMALFTRAAAFDFAVVGVVAQIDDSRDRSRHHEGDHHISNPEPGRDNIHSSRHASSARE